MCIGEIRPGQPLWARSSSGYAGRSEQQAHVPNRQRWRNKHITSIGGSGRPLALRAHNRRPQLRPGTDRRHLPLLMCRRMRVLITGITGFAGSHLAEYILAEHPGVAVFGTYRWRSRMENLETLMARGVLDVVEGRYSAGASQATRRAKTGSASSTASSPTPALWRSSSARCGRTHLPSRRAVIRAVLVRRARGDDAHQHRISAQHPRSDPPSRHEDPRARRRIERGIRPCLSR